MTEISENVKLAIKDVVKSDLSDVSKRIEAIEKDEAVKGDVANVKESIKGLSDKMDLVVKQADDFQAAYKASNKTMKDAEGFATINEALKAAILSNEVQKEIKEIVKNDGHQIKPLFIKAAVTMGLNTTIESGSTRNTITQDTGIVSTIRRREEKYFANVSVGAIETKHALWVEETDAQGVPIFIGEGTAKTQLSSLFIEKTKSVGKIAVYGKVTTEMLADASQLASFVESSLIKRVVIERENQLMIGDGTGNNLTGLRTYATAFTGAGLALAVDNANEFDVMIAVATQVEIAHGIPTALFVNTGTLARIKTLKATDGIPLYKQYTDILGEMTVNGMKIVPTTAVPAGEFFGGDTSVVKVLLRTGVDIQIGMDGNDFSNNLKTILVEQRLVQFVSANDTQCLVKGTFAAAKTALETT
jgi:hypothetical protein